jgi:hypothetical protein
MPLVKFANLDFDQIKQSIKDYIKSNSNFTDYDFEGSNLSVIIDTLAYNTYITSFNANMLSNEVFIDSATLRENVVSLARNIGYLPRSRRSAKANVSFFVDTSALSSNPLTLTLKAGVVATSGQKFGNESFVFTIPSDITVPVVNGIASFDNITIFEGNYITENFTVDINIPNQRFELGNPDVDTSNLVVKIYPTQQSNSFVKYNLKNDLFQVTSTSNVYFLQEISDQRYELFFGDGVFGRKLDNNNYIEVNYTVSNGEDGNDVSIFSYAGRILDNNSTVVTSDISALTTNSASSGGQDIESVDSIRKFAPKSYAAADRAVTSMDYEAIIPQIYGEVESISAFGGEVLNPPQFGRVFISIKPINGQYLSNSVKENLIEQLKQYQISGISPIILDTKFTYVEFNTTSYFDPSLAPNAAYVKAAIAKNIEDYANSTELNKYGAKFRYSRFTRIIDESDNSITSNITNIIIRRDLVPQLRVFAEYEICFGNSFCVNPNGYNIKTSGFTVTGIADTVYFSDTPNKDLKTGSIFLFKVDTDTDTVILLKNIGTVDYVKGEIKLSPIKIQSAIKSNAEGPIIEVSTEPSSNDVIGKEELYLQLDINNSTINMLADNIASGADISGSNFVSTASCGKTGSLIRN